MCAERAVKLRFWLRLFHKVAVLRVCSGSLCQILEPAVAPPVPELVPALLQTLQTRLSSALSGLNDLDIPRREVLQLWFYSQRGFYWACQSLLGSVSTGNHFGSCKTISNHLHLTNSSLKTTTPRRLWIMWWGRRQRRSVVYSWLFYSKQWQWITRTETFVPPELVLPNSLLNYTMLGWNTVQYSDIYDTKVMQTQTGKDFLKGSRDPTSHPITVSPSGFFSI